MKRRNFLQTVPLIGAGALLSNGLSATEKEKAITNHREYWLELMDQLAGPLLKAGSQRKLKASMPVETTTGAKEKPSTYLEGVGRLLAGMAPWLELEPGNSNEIKLRKGYRKQALETISGIVDPKSPDYLFDHMEPQMLVDAAFLAHAFLRAPKQLWLALDSKTKQQVVSAFTATREVKPYYSNWLLFSAMIEAFFLDNDLPFDIMRLDLPVKKHQEWYLGDGLYGDGPDFHWDYYNSYVIQPMLMDIVTVMADKKKIRSREVETIARRFTRYAAIQERLISPEGTFPAIGRSIAYRMGAFQHLAQASLQERLPEDVHPAQVRCALSSLMKRLMDAPGTYDKDGWLKIGLVGHQNALGEHYISTGSLYLCSTALLPLGLPPENLFWAANDSPWTSSKIWNGEQMKADKAL
ncbi:DUF2264 domain-containing protein [uncultured Sunxiuqinia sp.]|uniref:DUF2264 domain-containing protein n=1 Tax=uncultured Sunxiuqinia sp. TaxID=1573825 RepID=UPI0030DB818D|tara:strand:- start:16403 stop:17632 length:1230 start_codon:yes stop_codon:yes gene_type:complete